MTLSTQQQLVLGIDVGGTNTAWGLVDRAGNCPRAGSVSTRAAAGPQALVDRVLDDANGALRALGAATTGALAGVGIGAPNGNYHAGTVEHPPNLPWPGITPLARLFEQRSGVRAFLTNDANAAALGEGLFGAGRGLTDYVVVTLGTGLGSGFVTGGRLLYGHDGFAGELGHTLVQPGGRLCGCGRRGCLETYASATGLVTTVREWLEAGNRASRLGEVPIEQLTARNIAEAAAAGDPLAQDAFEYTASILGVALANAVAITSPQAVILFGGVAQAGDLLLRPLRAHFEAALHSIWRGKVELRVSPLHDRNAAVLGAAALVWDELDRA